MTAKIYQSGQYCETVPYSGFEFKDHGIILYSDEDCKITKAIIPYSMMIIFDNSGNPDYDKIGKELREKKV